MELESFQHAAKENLGKIESKRISQALGVTGFLVTISISPFSSYDPINPVKNLVLLSGAGFVLGILISARSLFSLRHNLLVKTVVFSFLLALINPLIFAKADLQQQLFGIFGRNNGFLSYLGLLFLLLGAASISDTSLHERVVFYLFFSTIPVGYYGLIQSFGKDPVAWSSFAAFGTLGNVNFMSSFLGLGIISTTIVVFSPKMNQLLRILAVTHAAILFYVLIQTDSSQGFFVLAVGLSFIFLQQVRFSALPKFLYGSLLIIIAAVLVQVVMGFVNKGLLARIVYQPTLTFRFDYMQAGLKMLLNNPISGVGMDSYDDYYRESRGLISAIRTGPNRVANTAHNLPIDLGASGGFPLLLSWLVLQAIAFYVLLRSLKRQESFDATLVVLGALWLSYLAQTFISINQISISVWGWIFTGSLIGQFGLFGKINQKNVETRQKNKNVSNARRNPSQTTLLRPAAAGTAFLIGVLGFFSTFPVYATDKSFRAASLKSDTKLMGELSLGLGGNAWLLSQAIQSFGNAKDPAGAKQFAEEMIKRYPRNIYGWQILNMLENVPPSERNDAFRELRSLDPYNPCFSQDYVPLVLNWFNALSPKQQREVIGFWFLPSLSKYGPLEIPTNWRSVVPEEELSNRIVRFCRD